MLLYVCSAQVLNSKKIILTIPNEIRIEPNGNQIDHDKREKKKKKKKKKKKNQYQSKQFKSNENDWNAVRMPNKNRAQFETINDE